MTERLIVAYGLFLAIGVFLAIVWFNLTRGWRKRGRQRRRAHRVWRREAAAARLAAVRFAQESE